MMDQILGWNFNFIIHWLYTWLCLSFISFKMRIIIIVFTIHRVIHTKRGNTGWVLLIQKYLGPKMFQSLDLSRFRNICRQQAPGHEIQVQTQDLFMFQRDPMVVAWRNFIQYFWSTWALTAPVTWYHVRNFSLTVSHQYTKIFRLEASVILDFYIRGMFNLCM